MKSFLINHLSSPEVSKNVRFAEAVCQRYGRQKDFYTILREQLDVVDCIPVMTTKKKPEAETEPNLLIGLSIVGTLLVLVVVAFLYLLKTKKWKLLHKLFFTLNSSSSSRGKSTNTDVEVSLISGLFYF